MGGLVGVSGRVCWQSLPVDEGEQDAVAGLAIVLGVPTDQLRAAIGGPWLVEELPATLDAFVTIMTGLENPRTPNRPLIALRVEHEEGTIEVGHAVGVPLPNGRMQWAFGEPRTLLPYEPEELREHLLRTDPRADTMSSDDLVEALLAELSAAIGRVADVAMLRGTTW
jgi:hypothetical protein